MPESPSFLWFLACSFLLGAGMLVALNIGWRRGDRLAASDPVGADKGTSALDGAVFALFGLLLAFTFSSAIARFGERRELINAEANAIGTAYLRLDLLSEPHRSELRESFRRYVKARLEAHHVGTVDDLLQTQALQREIWSRTIVALQQHDRPISGLLLEPINEMIDLTSSRWMASRAHPPMIIFAMLFALAMACALLAGQAMGVTRRRHHLHAWAFALSISGIVYVILDIEYPRAGLIRVDRADSVLRLLLEDIQATPAGQAAP